MATTLSTSGLGFSIKVTNVTGLQFDADSRSNVKKRIANILYLEEPPPDAVLLSYAGTEELKTSNALFIGDRSNKLFPNSRNNLNTEFIYYSSPVGVQHKNILVTQKFAESTAADIPLYFKHSLSTSVDVESVKILDKDFNEVSPDHYLVELELAYSETTGLPEVPTSYTALYIYNSLENSYNLDTGEFEVYYVQYRDSWNDVKTVLLDNNPAYPEATIDDIWSLTGSIAPWAKAYTIDSSTGGYFIDLPTLSNQKFAVRYTTDSKIYVEDPVAKDDTSLWLPRVANGSFSWTYNSISYIHEIPEFVNQSFNPIEPYKLTDRSQATKISNNLLKLAHEDLETSDFMHAFSLLIEYNEEIIYALTTDSSLVGTRYRNFDGNYVYYNGEVVTWSSNQILSIDRKTGIVQVSIDLKDYWKYFCTYNYEEKFYELSSLNMNPIYDREIHTQIKSIYLVPVSIANNNSGSQTRSIQYLTINSDGVIEDTSQDGTGGNNIENITTQLSSSDGYSLSGVIGMHYSWRASTYITANCTIDVSQAIYVEDTNKFPRNGWIRIFDGTYWRYAKFDDKTSTTLVLSDNDDGSGGSLGAIPNPGVSITYSSSSNKAVELVNFIDEHSATSVRDHSQELTTYGETTGYPNLYHRYFVLAEMAINPPHSIYDTTLFDLRTDGGNIDPEKYEEAKLKQPEAQWYFDYLKYDGQPTPGNAAVVIKLPYSLLNDFTEEQIEAIVERNIPFGIKPLIRYYGYQPQVVYVGPTDANPYD